MTNPGTTTIFVVARNNDLAYYLLKVIRHGHDVYCIPPHLGMHYSLHESGAAHIRVEGSGEEVPVIITDGEAGIPAGNGIMRAPLVDIGRAICVCYMTFPIDSLSDDFREFNRHPSECFVIDTSLFPKRSNWVEIGIWAVPERNKASFDFNNRDVSEKLLYRSDADEPQIWIYARPV